MEITENWLKDNDFTRKGETKWMLPIPVDNIYLRAYVEVTQLNNKLIAHYTVNGYKASNPIDSTECVEMLVRCVVRGGRKKPPPIPRPTWGLPPKEKQDEPR